MVYKSLLFIFIIISIVSCDTNVKDNNKSDIFVLTDLEKEQYLAKGKEIIVKTGETLTKELKAKISEGGIETAINYCNVAALPLTDSIANLYAVKVRRVSDKIRNPANTPDSLESLVISDYKTSLSLEEPLQAKLVNENGSIRFMAPIILNDLCLKCHGTPNENISSTDRDFILKAYPQDQAIDYKVGELRGIWSVTFSE
jgi:hypothetical protein